MFDVFDILRSGGYGWADGTRRGAGRLSDQNDSRKGRSPPERDAGDMIEHQSEQHSAGPDMNAAALDEARLRQQAIGVRLRQMFDEVVNEPVPDEFLDILRRADKSAENG